MLVGLFVNTYRVSTSGNSRASREYLKGQKPGKSRLVLTDSITLPEGALETGVTVIRDRCTLPTIIQVPGRDLGDLVTGHQLK